MPIYTFKCDKDKDGCGYDFELVMSMKSYTPSQVCPKCKSENVHRNYQFDNSTSIMKLSDEQLKLEHLAKRNGERLSTDEKAHLDYKHNEYKYNKKGGVLPEGVKRRKSKYDKQ